MFGSIFYNLWGALIAFSIYFFSTFLKPYTPLRIIIGSFVAGIIVFFVMYIVRFLIAYILFTPEDAEEVVDSEHEENESGNREEDNQETPTANSTVEFQDENSEEIAQVVRTMMNREDDPQLNSA
ncbi:multidrug resistance efflux pump [Lysinibacillus sp. CTST325]